LINGCQLSVVGCRLSVVGCQLSVVSCQLSVVSWLPLFSLITAVANPQLTTHNRQPTTDNPQPTTDKNYPLRLSNKIIIISPKMILWSSSASNSFNAETSNSFPKKEGIFFNRTNISSSLPSLVTL
jgi:hypothetical protein